MSRKISLDQIGYTPDIVNLFEPSENSDNNLQLEHLKKALEKVIHTRLTTRQQEILTMYYFEKMKMPEIAQLLGVNKSSVSRTLNRAIENIRLYLEFCSPR